MNSYEKVLEWLRTTWSIELFKLGDNAFMIKTIIMLIFSFFLLFYLSGKIRRVLAYKVFPRYSIDVGVGQSIATIVRYLLLIIGVIIIFQTSGIDLSALGILVGALGVGIGFGLQHVTNNFISGIIILFERPVKVGDRVEVDGLTGNIVNISARATTILTNDNIAVIVPNSDLINKQVVNWSHNNKNVRIHFPLGVSYKEDPERVRKILLSVAKANPGVLQEPPPYVRFDEFGDSSLNFNMLVWTSEYSDKPSTLKSELYYAVFKAFKEHGIEIPFPQRDVHIKSNPKD
ncbi:MAG: mechanosensitive ion channel protein MscS [Bacteroidetes bacterium GWE2_39_28]|nr:MAG: mechanosensitive ion channel protein MscS [Bacteroidetes bacterium GWE2_39_28]OFY15808.1 MAG: mechanosensitive ion channel protein MscS [Bacteroidetes bacterium GWF2_39_10]OFZ06893.1 MAG: mechanosensitive ion channel protein MscS [Bacteroidetes bacterium RIFOXYB2_FULL_39_7]OFZ09976.1 MAG: mechanosensitive ion channel protein MscS [Bacteroidetes bacterium RIFOXYC2_FULL_39_11]HCT93519.1 mechanosensitive ion channel protein MscS [Rikenellaceae bacterium]